MQEKLAQLMEDYLIHESSRGSSAATLKNKRSYCTQFITACSTRRKQQAVGAIDEADISYFAELLWGASATDSTISSKVNEAIRWVRWIAERGLMPTGGVPQAMTAADLIARLRSTTRRPGRL